MCGRFTLRTSPQEIAETFELLRVPDLTPRYNIAPTQSVAAVRPAEGGRELAMLRWGLVPPWAKDAKGAARLINARAETVATKPAFRSAFRRRRCLVPADGFYEWQATDGKKQPFLISLHGGGVFAFAGLWERWDSPDGTPLETCTIITTEANELLRSVHDRMPVLLDEEDYDRWLDPGRQNVDDLEKLLVPFPADRMGMVRVSTAVNNARFDAPECVEPVADPAH